MSYRVNKHKHSEPQRSMHDTTTHGDIYVNNGIITNLAIPCFYYIVDPPAKAELHDEEMHNHLGWPAPGFKSDVCQPHDFAYYATLHPEYPLDKAYSWWRREIDMDALTPVHLKEEYGDSAIITSHVDTKGLATVAIDGSIDPKDDWIIRLTFDIISNKANTEKVVCPLSILINSTDGSMRDLVYQGNLIILPNFIVED